MKSLTLRWPHAIPSTEPRAKAGASDVRVALIVGLHVCVTIPLGFALNIWIDEAYSLLTTSRDIGFALEHSREFQHYPPLYYVQLWLWRTLDSSVWFARMNSVIVCALGLWAAHAAARRWLPAISSAWVVGPLAVNVYVLYAATEIRAYAMVFLLSAVLLVLFHDAFYAERTELRARVLFSVVALISLMTFYFIGFLLAALPAALILERRWNRLASYAKWMAGVSLLYLPGFVNSAGDAANISHALLNMPGTLRTLTFVGTRMVSMPLSLTQYGSAVRWTVVLCVAIGAIVAAWRYRRAIPAHTRALWGMCVTLGLCYALLVRLVLGEELMPRHSIVVLFPMTLGIVSLAALPNHNTYALAVWAVAAVALNATASYERFSALAKPGDYARVAGYLEQNERRGESIVVVTSHAELPLKQYYEGSSALVPLPERDDFANYLPEEWRLGTPEDTARKLSAAESSDGSIWVLTDRPPGSVFLGVDLNFESLETALAQHYDRLGEQNFYRAKVRHYRAKNRPEFSAGQDAPATQTNR